MARALLQDVSLGTLDAPTFAPATGYISFFTLVLYIGGLLMIMFATNEDNGKPAPSVVPTSHQLQPLPDCGEIKARNDTAENPARGR